MKIIREHAFWLGLVVLAGGCGGGQETSGGWTLELDPKFMLLRDDLPTTVAAIETNVFSGVGDIGGWMPDVVPLRALGAGGADIELFDGPVSLAIPSVAVRLVLDPVLRTLRGEATIRLRAEDSDLASVQFVLSAAEVDAVQAENPQADYSYEDQTLTITPASPIPSGAEWEVLVTWHDQDIEMEVELFPEGFKRNVLIGFLGQPSTFFTFGYWYWPRPLDVLSMGDLEFAVTYPGNLTLVMSGQKLGTIDNLDDTHTDTWRIGHRIQGHTSLALAAYERASGSCGSTDIEVYGIPGQSMDGFPIRPVAYVPVLESVCEHFSALFGEPAFETIRMVGVDERFTNGYASPSLIIVPNYTLDDDGSGSFAERDFFIAHELSHQWWGNDVLMASERDAWLTEGLADYCAIGYLADAWGEEASLRAWLLDAAVLLQYYREDGRDHPLVPELPTEMEPIIYYLKGAWIFRMLGWVIGEEAVREALRSYRAAHRFSAATTQDFIDATETAAGEHLSWFFEQWLHGTGLLSLRESHVERQGSVQVTVTQRTPWSTSPERYFRMPLNVWLIRDEVQREETVFIEGGEFVFDLQEP